MSQKTVVGLLATLSALGALACASTNAPPAHAPATAGAPHSSGSEDFRRQRPPAAAAPQLRAPVPHHTTLANGLQLFVVPQSELPLIEVAVVIKSGSGQDPAALPGLAGLMAEAMKSGTKKRTAQAIAADVETLGASLNVDVDEDATFLSSSLLSDHFRAILAIMADVVQQPAFAPAEIDRVREHRLAAIAQRFDDPAAAAYRVFRRVVYANHPYGHEPLGDPAALSKISRQALVDFYRCHVVPQNIALVLVGNLTDQEAQAAVTESFGAWRPPTAACTAKAAPPLPEPRVRPAGLVVVNRPGAPQSQLRVGQLGAARHTPDYYSLVLLNAVLGGLFNSRLNMNLREDKGITYGARSRFDFWRQRGTFSVSTAVETKATDLAVREILKEIDLIRTQDVGAAELEAARNRFALSLPSYFQTTAAIADMVAELFVYDLPLNFFEKLPHNLAGVTTADVRRAATVHLNPAQLSIVVVGDREQVGAGLLQLERGTLEIRDADGKVL